MSGLRHRANLAYTWLVVRGRRLRERRDVAWLRLRSLPPLWRREQVVDRPTALFSRRALRGPLRGHVQRAAWREPGLRLRLADTRIEGVRQWEYGTLLGALAGMPERESLRVLDVGAGKSALPAYLIASGNAGEVTTLDLPDSFEAEASEIEEVPGVTRALGSMTEIPFDDGSFDLVLCISAIEHLDGDRLAAKRGRAGGERLPYDRYLEVSAQTVSELMRVTKPGGRLYLTTDAYLSDRQKTDTWTGNDGSEPIWSAYRMEDVPRLFIQPLLEAGFELPGGAQIDPQLLIEDPDHANYRGRYFTTFAVWGRKGG